MSFVQAAFWYSMGSMHLALGMDGIWMDSTHHEAFVIFILAPRPGLCL